MPVVYFGAVRQRAGRAVLGQLHTGPPGQNVGHRLAEDEGQ